MHRIVSRKPASFELNYPVGGIIIEANIGASARTQAGVMQQREKMKAKLPTGLLKELAKRLSVGTMGELLAEAIDEPLHERNLLKTKDVALSTNCSPVHSAYADCK